MFTPFAYRATKATAAAPAAGWSTANLKLLYDAQNAGWGSGTSINDLSGGVGAGTLTNGATFVSGTPNYWDFDGSNDYIAGGNDADLPAGTQARTFFVWINITRIQDTQGIFQYGTQVLNAFQAYYFGTGDAGPGDGWAGFNSYNFGWYGLTGGSFPPQWAVWTANQWQMIFFATDTNGSQFTAGVNNSFGATNSTNGVQNINTTLDGTFTVASELGTTAFIQARIGAVAFYDKYMSTTEITANYNNTKAAYGL